MPAPLFFALLLLHLGDANILRPIEGPVSREDSVALADAIADMVAGRSYYPQYDPNNIPESSFRCSDYSEPGLYADVELECQIIHHCDNEQNVDAYHVCPNMTVFDQQLYTCSWAPTVDCQNSPKFYGEHGGEGGQEGGFQPEPSPYPPPPQPSQPLDCTDKGKEEQGGGQYPSEEEVGGGGGLTDPNQELGQGGAYPGEQSGNEGEAGGYPDQQGGQELGPDGGQGGSYPDQTGEQGQEVEQPEQQGELPGQEGGNPDVQGGQLEQGPGSGQSGGGGSYPAEESESGGGSQGGSEGQREELPPDNGQSGVQPAGQGQGPGNNPYGPNTVLIQVLPPGPQEQGGSPQTVILVSRPGDQQPSAQKNPVFVSATVPVKRLQSTLDERRNVMRKQPNRNSLTRPQNNRNSMVSPPSRAAVRPQFSHNTMQHNRHSVQSQANRKAVRPNRPSMQNPFNRNAMPNQANRKASRPPVKANAGRAQPVRSQPNQQQLNAMRNPWSRLNTQYGFRYNAF